jgi:hypothetical protein
MRTTMNTKLQKTFLPCSVSSDKFHGDRTIQSIFARRLGVVFLLALVACDGGLQPPAEAPPTQIAGTIRYVGGWPPAVNPITRDSVLNIRVAAFRDFPPQNIVTDVLAGRAYFTPSALSLDSSLARFVDVSSYSILIPDNNPATEIRYVAVAMLVRSLFLVPASWRIVGVYTVTGNQAQPGTIRITPNTIHRADITVDFRNPPPQPF